MKVLLVDDDPLSLELSKTFLELFHDITSDTVNSAQEALERLENDSYDVVVSDYDMPIMDGITFLKTIRDRSINIPFIMFTGVSKEDVSILNCQKRSGRLSAAAQVANKSLRPETPAEAFNQIRSVWFRVFIHQ